MNALQYEVYNVNTNNVISKPAPLDEAQNICDTFTRNSTKSYAVRPVFDYDAFIADVTAQDLEDRMVDAVAVEKDRQWGISLHVWRVVLCGWWAVIMFASAAVKAL